MTGEFHLQIDDGFEDETSVSEEGIRCIFCRDRVEASVEITWGAGGLEDLAIERVELLARNAWRASQRIARRRQGLDPGALEYGVLSARSSARSSG